MDIKGDFKMVKKLFAFVLVLSIALGGASLGASSAYASKIVTDNDGNKVEVPDKVSRIAVAGIFPLPSVLAVYMGSASKLVAMSAPSMSAAKSGILGELFPEILKANTGFMKGGTINIEELMTLKPDVVFYSAGMKDWAKMFKSAGLPAIAVSPKKWNYNVLKTYDEWISLISKVVDSGMSGEKKSAKISAYSKKNYSMIQKRVKNIPEGKRKKVLFLFNYDDKQMVTSGKNFFGQFWCDAVGAENAAGEIVLDNDNAVITMEQVYKWDPDVVVITNFTAAEPEDIYKNKIGGHDWSSVKAVKNHAVYKMPLGSYRSYTPSSDTPLTLLWLAQKVYPELFKNVDIEKETEAYYKNMFGVSLTNAQIKRMYAPKSIGKDNFRIK